MGNDFNAKTQRCKELSTDFTDYTDDFHFANLRILVIRAIREQCAFASLRLWVVGLLLVGAGVASPVRAHPLGNFSIGHYARLRVTRDAIRLRYALDMAEIPTFQEMPQLDANGDHDVSASEKRAYLQNKMKELASRLTLTVNGESLTWRVESADLKLPSQTAAAPTMRLIADLQAELPKTLRKENDVFYEDKNYPERTGWKEIVVQARDGVRLLKSSVPLKDRSAELTKYPSDLSAPPQDVSADVTFAWGASGKETESVLSITGKTSRSPSYLWLVGIMLAAMSLFLRYRSARHGDSPARCPSRPARPPTGDGATTGRSREDD